MFQNIFLLELLLLLLNLEITLGNFTNSPSVNCAKNQSTSCVLCKSSLCIKCPKLIIYPTRECVTECPSGYKSEWSTFIDFMGQICVHSGYLGGLSGETAAVVIGIAAGAVICLIIISLVALYIKYKRKNPSNLSSEVPSDTEDSPERRDFLKQLEILRPHATTFLDMLNDTRRQIRELHNAGDNAAITAYKPVVRDLAKILLLLNRQIDKLVIPDDWEHLFTWAEKTLKRFKRMSNISQPQVAQLVSFLQTPVRERDTLDSSTYSQTLSTFKPDQQQVGTSSVNLQDIAVKTFNSNYDNMLNPQWSFNYSVVNTNPVSESNTWQGNDRDFLNSSYLLEDDFFQFGFRPQDEITTEL